MAHPARAARHWSGPATASTGCPSGWFGLPQVVSEFGGDAATIWSDTPRAADLAARLRRFHRIAQKKSAMAVEILARDLGVPVREFTGSDIAYDVHVRRVFLRTGLAAYDDPDHMIEVARRLHPQRPGELDSPPG